MIWVESACWFSGDSYSPALAERLAKLSFVEKNEVGEHGRYGKYKNKPMPFGSSVLAPPCEVTVENVDFGMEWLLKVVSEHKHVFKAAGVDSTTLRLNVFHDGQCNMEFSAEQLRMMVDAGVDLTISCEEGAGYVEKKVREVQEKASENKDGERGSNGR